MNSWRRPAQARAQADKHEAQIKSATLALEKGIQICEQGRPRLGILSIAYALQLCPTDAHDLRRVILTNLASWGPHLMCLDEIHTMPMQIVATDPAGKYALLARIVDKLSGRAQLVFILEFQLYDVNTEKPAGQPFRVQGTPDGMGEFRQTIERVRLLPSGVALFTGGGKSSVWDTVAGKPLGKWISHGEGIAAISPDGKLVAGCNGRGDMRIYDSVTGVPREGRFQHMGKVNDLAFSADGRYLVTGCGHGPTSRWTTS